MHQAHESSRIEVLEILCFFKNFYKTIFSFCLLFVAAAILYLIQIPPKYESVAYIVPVEVSVVDFGSIGQKKVPIESFDKTIIRLKSPNFFVNRQLEVCGIQNNLISASQFLGRLSISKVAESILEIRLTGEDKNNTEICIGKIIELIGGYQANLLGSYIRDLQYRRSLSMNAMKKMTISMDKEVTGSLDQYLLGALVFNELLNQSIAINANHPEGSGSNVSLLNPIYTEKLLNQPNRKRILLLALILGFGFGVIFVFAREYMASLMSESNRR